MLNRVVLVGRLTKDPELRYTPSGVAVANFTLAVNRAFSNQQGEREADFINCVVWRKPAENVANYLKKGSLAGVDGRIQTRSYDNNEGRRVFITEVVAESVQFLEPKGSNQGQGNAFPSGGSPTGGNDYSRQNQQPNRQSGGFNDDPFANDGKPIDISDDDLPF
ncbi:single-stranded DNA-binding protein [Alkalihalophilus sp. As8PL]|jgi:single-strand DNA-binding protein|uniref:Single-stranded DNA-binding protein n=2 Tax=Alkalihalophilus TaxID=2893060 RepID=A0AB39BNP8_9BACI|nr:MULTISPECIES: single-stranded DNA-binding protein [Bacillaceae]KMJ56472.1 single-stranded DNA-binding protein [Bacillus sp. LL01]MDV2684701.1 single-stranded DNA-binding protein [Alkalihalophilus lindianensis]